MTKRYALRDDQWVRIEPLLPGRPGHVGANARHNRLFVEAVLYRYRSGIAWRDLLEALWRLSSGAPAPRALEQNWRVPAGV